MIKTYKIPYKYEVMQFNGAEDLDELQTFIGDDWHIYFVSNPNHYILLKSSKHDYSVNVDIGDYIIKNHLGELFGNSAERFSKHFKEVERMDGEIPKEVFDAINTITNREIPKEVFDAINTIACFCRNHVTCSICPLHGKKSDDDPCSYCKLKEGHDDPDRWDDMLTEGEKVIKKTVYRVVE